MLILGLKGLTTPIGSLAGTQFVTSPSRLVPNSRQPAELTGYLGRLCRLLL